jgi:hypothetical protein
VQSQADDEAVCFALVRNQDFVMRGLFSISLSLCRWDKY